MLKENPANKIDDDVMWNFFKTYGQKANIPALKEYAYDLIQMLTQKTNGQRKSKKGVNFEEDWDMTVNSIAIEAVALVLSGELDKLENEGGIE